MKKIFTLLFALLSVSLAWAQDETETGDGSLAVGDQFTYGDLVYKILTLEDDEEDQQQNTISIVGHIDNMSTDLVIPSSVDYDNISFTVTEIAGEAFMSTYITSVTIPETITTTGDNAFCYCGSLSKVNFSGKSSLKEIGIRTFGMCTSLVTIEIPSSVTTINSNVFESCTSLETVKFAEDSQLQLLRSWTFQNCTSLTTVKIPTSCTTMEGYVFYECSALKTVTFGEGIKIDAIPQFAFFRCYSLESVEIPASVKTIGQSAFDMSAEETVELTYTPALEKVTFATGSLLETIGDYAFLNCTNLASVEIPSTVTSLGISAFDNTALTEVTLPEGLVTIGNFAFYRCSNLISVELPSTVTSLGISAFDGTGLTEITLPAGLQTMGNYTFLNCNSLASVTIPATVTSIGVDCFGGCPVTSLTITGNEMTTTLQPTDFVTTGDTGSGDTEVSDRVLYVSLGLSDSYTNAGWGDYFTIYEIPVVGGSFTDDDGLVYKILTLDEDTNSYTVAVVGFADDAKDVTSLKIPSVVECQYDESTVSFTVTEIGDSAFSSNQSLSKVTFAENSALETISAFAFFRCYSLESVEIPASVKTIGWGAFEMSVDSVEVTPALAKVTFEADSKLEIIATYAFHNCSSLETIEIPSSVTTIECNVFEGCSALTTVTFAEKSQLQSIGCWTFQNCTSLATINIPTGCTTLAYNLFYGCTKLETIEIPSSITEIGVNIFEGCSALKTVTFGEGIQLEEIPQFAFFRCYSLESVVIPASVKTIGWGAFEMSVDEGVEVTPALEKVTFESNDALETIDGFAFWCCTNLTSIEIPSTVTSLGTSAFDNTGLTEVILPESLQTMGDYVFYNCVSLTSVTIPATVTSIGERCFDGCPLTSLTITGEAMTTTLQPTNFNVAENSGCVLYVNEKLGNNYYDSDWSKYFTIDGFLAVGGRFTYDGLIYQILTLEDVEDGQQQNTISIVGHTDNMSTDLVIPSSVDYDGYSFTVTEIGSATFYGTSIFEVTLPESVQTMGDYVFLNCTSLTSVTIPATVTSIGESCFDGCPLTSLTITGEAMTTTLQPTNFNVAENSGCVLYVNNGLEVSYHNSDWANYFTIDGYIEGTEIVDEESVLTYVITDQYKNEVTITDFTCSESVTIPASISYNDVEYTIVAVAEGVFDCEDLKEVTMEATEPPFEVSAFTGIHEGVVLKVGENQSAYVDWHDTFIIYGYVEAGDKFEVDGIIYQVLDTETVEIVGATSSEITIVENVEYNNLTFTVTQIADNAFDEQTNLTVTVNFESPDAITLGTIATENIGTLSVPEGYEWTFYNSDWATYFTIDGDITFTTEDGFVYTVTDQTNSEVELTKYSGNDTSIEISESVTYDSKECIVKSIADNAFTDKTGLTVTVKFEDPTTITLGTIASGNIGTLSVPVGYEWAFYNSAWATYFTIDGDITFTVDDFTYTLTSYGDTDVTISAYNGTGGDITIEPTVTADNDKIYTIVEIGNIFNDITLTSVTVKWDDPTTVSPVGAFTEDSSVTLRVPDGLEVSYHDSIWGTYFNIDGYIIGAQFSVDNLTYEITDQYENEVKIVEFKCSASVTIPETVRYSVSKETYTVTDAIDAVFACDDLKEVTMSASKPPFEVSAFTGIPEGVVLKVGENQEAYASWHGTFIIYGYVKAGDQFSDDVFTYTVLSDTKTVQITALQSTAGTTFGIPTGVTYNGLDFTVTSIADGVFTDKTGLTVSVTFTNTSTITLGTIANGNVGTLSVPEGSERNFENSLWSAYFTIANFIEGTQFTESGITYEITDQYTYEVKIVGFYCSESVVIPESVAGYTITAVDSDVFNCSDLISVTMEANTPPFSSSAFSSISENAVLYVDNISAYTTSSDNWHKYFTIYGYLEAGDTFSDDVFSYKVLSGAETVEITGIVTTGLSFTINTEVGYNGLTLTIASVDGSIFNGKSDLDVIANFKDPEAPKIDNYNGSQVGTLEVPDGYLYIFTDTNWEKYFVIEGTYLLKDGVQYYFQKDGTADVVGIDTSEPIIFTDRVEGFAIETIEEEIFEGYRDLEVEITVVNPFSIALEERVDKSFKYGEITVPDGCNSLYVGTVWEDYFNIYGETYFTDGSGVYYIFHIEVIEVDEDGVEVLSLNKALKATTTEYRITLEVAYVDPEVTEVTVPRTIDLGDDSSSNTSYEITAMNADALKDCKDLVTINLEAAIPAEDINALNYVPDAVTIVVDEDLGEDYCDSIVKVAEQLNIGVEIKSSSTGIRKVVFTKSDEKNVEIERYNLLGQRISAPQRGINIIKYSDGTIEKVLVK